MLTRIAIASVAVLACAITNAQSLSLRELTGVWIYESYAEIETPEAKMPVGARMDFRPDGTVIMTLSSVSAEGAFTLDGDTIRYSDPNGVQVWTIRSYEPNESLVVEYQRALLFFRRADE
jgi:hypothetical protein